jgi:hypothetical protein
MMVFDLESLPICEHRISADNFICSKPSINLENHVKTIHRI